MKFDQSLQSATFLKRYKRFFADVRLGDATVVAHVPNTGSLRGCIEAEGPCLISTSDDPKRKLKHTLQMIKSQNSWVGVNTALPSRLVWELWQSGQRWSDYDCAQPEVKISGESRIDLVLWNSIRSYAKNEKLTLAHCERSEPQLHFIEIKNVTLAEEGQALFPDCESTRAQKHVRELISLVERGHTAEFVFVVQRADCDRFRAAHHIDAKYAALLAQAHGKGVLITPLQCELNESGIELKPAPLPFSL